MGTPFLGFRNLMIEGLCSGYKRRELAGAVEAALANTQHKLGQWLPTRSQPRALKVWIGRHPPKMSFAMFWELVPPPIYFLGLLPLRAFTQQWPAGGAS